jgi:tetratricopeptide (TPR) repeat protein
LKKPNNNSYDGEQSHDDFNAEMRPIAVRFEAMIDTNTNALFEDEELEDLFEYYGYQNKWIRAEQVADFLIENNPYSGEFYVRKAQAALALENTHTAFETLEIAESFDPFNYEIFLVRATAYEFLDEFDQAFADFEHALSLADTEGKGLIYTAMAAAYINQENFQKAKIYFKKALEINPDNIEALNDLCYAYHESEENIALGIDFF